MNSSRFNLEAAGILRKCAEVLRQQAANPFRVNAYIRAAQTLESLQEDARDILRDDGVSGLIALPAIGRGLAASIDEIARTGRLSQLDRLRGETPPENLFRTVPGIGPKLAHAIHDALHVDTLEALEVAAHDGRLTAVPGVGARRAAAIQAGLAALLGRGRGRQRVPHVSPPVEMLLDVDREYRQNAAAEKLPKIAPKRFNPEGLAWLPILHTDRGKWHFTALFSNTARAHELGRTDDWVVVFFYNDDHQEGQNTIVTETKGPMTGERVIRGREAECRALTN
ncbi:MAG: helix-hairpin-helix domain-containing protein [Gammaproteobacteria bacterium]|nr:helix-hairpin-helix domain-containing protein [Gammaproteobacteria bacterium]MDH3416188.1 helix-hairpin-helix domain-containing protein [Gammaproteobacteria bacterium]